jgi:hypothetical protein
MLRRSLHRGNSQACSESMHVAILTMWCSGSQRRQVVAVAQGPECWGAPSISALFCYTLQKRPYSPECVEGVFSELRPYGVLGSSPMQKRAP